MITCFRCPSGKLLRARIEDGKVVDVDYAYRRIKKLLNELGDMKNDEDDRILQHLGDMGYQPEYARLILQRLRSE